MFAPPVTVAAEAADEALDAAHERLATTLAACERRCLELLCR
jgi:hypothetical protein